MPARLILQEWQARKLSHAQAIEDLYRSRDRGLIAGVRLVTDVRDRELAAEREEVCRLRFMRLGASLQKFREHPVIDRFLAAFRDVEGSVAFRFKLLLLRGPSRAAKTQKAASLFGYQHSLVVNMQGLGANLPSLRMFSKERYKAIIFDEATHEQVLANKMLFQGGALARDIRPECLRATRIRCGRLRRPHDPLQ